MRVNRLFFWVTGATTICSLFLFVFGFTMLSYFLTGNEDIDMFAVVKIMEQLPDPRVFMSDCFRIYNRLISTFKSVDLSYRLPGFNPLNLLLTIGDTIYSFITWILSILVTVVISIIFFPIYCVYFTFQTVGALLQIIGVTVPALPVWEPLKFIGV